MLPTSAQWETFLLAESKAECALLCRDNSLDGDNDWFFIVQKRWVLVGNLTLEKMKVGLESYTKEQFLTLPEKLEGRQSAPSEPLRIAAEYTLGDAPVARGKRLVLRHEGSFRCTICARESKKLFDGCCYPCFQKSAQADRCLLNPVNCHYMEGTCREPEWGKEFCYQGHYVYLAFTDKLKVGITRCSQVPVRWVDQGATMAVLLAKVGSRHQAGKLEHLLTQKYADKSHWLKMLKSGNTRLGDAEFERGRREALAFLRDELAATSGSKHRAPCPTGLPHAANIELLETATVVAIEYPLWSPVPEKIASLNLEKAPSISSEILGIKGQYLLLSDGAFNVRRHEGFVVSCEILG